MTKKQTVLKYKQDYLNDKITRREIAELAGCSLAYVTQVCNDYDNSANLEKFHAQHPEKSREYKKKYRDAHKDEAVEYRRKYREANREKIKEYNKTYREEHKEQLRENRKRANQKPEGDAVQKTEGFYKYDMWHNAYTDQMRKAKDGVTMEEDVFIAANFINALGYGEHIFSHIEDIQAEWEKCDEPLKAQILSGWQKMDAEAEDEYEEIITHDYNGNKLDPEKNINLS